MTACGYGGRSVVRVALCAFQALFFAKLAAQYASIKAAAIHTKYELPLHIAIVLAKISYITVT
jgi:hypothetical protein